MLNRLSLFLLTALFAGSLVFSEVAHADCNESVRSLMQKISQKQIDLDQIEHRTRFWRRGQRFEYHLDLYEGENLVAEITIDNQFIFKEPWIYGVYIHQPEYMGKGLGSYLYSIAAKDVYVKTGMLLAKSDMTQPAANAVWAHLAEKKITQNDVFLKSALQSEEIDQMYKKFLTKVKVIPFKKP